MPQAWVGAVMQIAQLLSPNFGDRSLPHHAIGPAYLMIHTSGMRGPEQVLARLTDPRPDDPDKAVSAHYFIEQCGKITQLVDEEKKAWHAGRGCWRGETDMNSASIGIELDYRYDGDHYPDFPDAQLGSLVALCGDIQGRWKISAENVIGHSDYAPGRKADPGHKFPWRDMARKNIGVWPGPSPIAREVPTISESQLDLALIGYSCPVTGEMDQQSRDVVDAFQLRFLPDERGQGLTPSTAHRIAAVRRCMNMLNSVRLPHQQLG